MGLGAVEVKMKSTQKLLTTLLLLLMVSSSTAFAQSNNGTDPGSDKPPAAASESRTIDGQPVYKPGHGVTPPRVTYRVDPEYSKEARKAKYQGTCVLELIVDADGKPRDLKMVRSLGKGLDEKAMEAVEKWKFDPATKDGQPVAVLINVEVMFRLY